MTAPTPQTLRAVPHRPVGGVERCTVAMKVVDAHADAWEADRAALAEARQLVLDMLEHDSKLSNGEYDSLEEHNAVVRDLQARQAAIAASEETP